jgi:hypothetical protein
VAFLGTFISRSRQRLIVEGLVVATSVPIVDMMAFGAVDAEGPRTTWSNEERSGDHSICCNRCAAPDYFVMLNMALSNV